LACGKFDAMEFQHDLAPEAEGMGFVEDEVEPAANSPPFPLKDAPGGVGGAGDLLGTGVGCPALGGDIRDFVSNESKGEPEVAA
jgi:hypothetical protein